MPALSTAPTAASAPGPLGHPTTLPAMREAARRFEAQALGALLQPAFGTLHADRGAFGGGNAEAQWQPMLVDAYAESWSRRGGIGLADAVLREMLRMQGGASAAAPSDPSGGNAASTIGNGN
ncbi:rod-binding protein [Roseomonas sp. BN140053]|uniref:rod-binding protein n=1 Tax=Roseomonas sp. BN140053 TaxID=3391898 RepID=UPI0039E97463